MNGVSPRGDPDASLKCPITQDYFVDPVIGSCGHTFEKKDLMAWAQGQGKIDDEGHFSCPIDRQQDHISALKTNYAVKELAERAKEAADKALQNQNRSNDDKPATKGDLEAYHKAVMNVMTSLTDEVKKQKKKADNEEEKNEALEQVVQNVWEYTDVWSNPLTAIASIFSPNAMGRVMGKGLSTRQINLLRGGQKNEEDDSDGICWKDRIDNNKI